MTIFLFPIDASKLKGIGDLIDHGNDALALMGQVNYLLNMLRRELLRPELKFKYRSLCNSSLPVTDLLFGEDLTKATKEVEDRNKISSKLSTPFQYRGLGLRRTFSRGRGMRGIGPVFNPRMRGRSSYRRGYYNPYYYSNYSNYPRKNWKKDSSKTTKGKSE